MARYKEVRHIYGDKVRNLCIKESYYTMGTCTEYTHLLNDLCGKEVTVDGLEEIAEDIVKHSDTESYCEQYGGSEEEMIGNLLFELINECCVVTVERI